MGVDAEIYLRAKSEPDLWLPEGFELQSLDGIAYQELERAAGATHRVYTPRRYYGIGYERGPWPQICAVLMGAMKCEAVEKVWYFGDCSEIGDPITAEEILEISRHYLAVGHEPYHRP